MSSTHPSLAAGFARLRDSVSSDQAPAWLPETIHALILALLIRMLGRLEDLAALWQSGQLPPPRPHAASRRNRPATPRPARTGHHRRAPSRRHAAPALRPDSIPCASAPRQPGTRASARQAPGMPPRTSRAALPVDGTSHGARAPPRSAPLAIPPGCAEFVTISSLIPALPCRFYCRPSRSRIAANGRTHRAAEREKRACSA